MQISIEKIKDVIIAKPLIDVLDANNAKDFKSAMLSEIANKKKVILDMNQIKFLDSSGCGMILSCLRQLNSEGGDLKILGLQKPVQTMLKLVRMHRILEIFEQKEEAVNSF
jgi:anti-sigma B factor antagonist